MGVYVRAKFEAPSIILTGFSGNFTPHPTSKRNPKKPTQIRVSVKNCGFLPEKVKNEKNRYLFLIFC